MTERETQLDLHAIVMRLSGCGLSEGDKRGRLTVAGAQWREKRYWKCVARCDCGVSGVFLVHCIGKTTFSCGCYHKGLGKEIARKAVATKLRKGLIRPTAERLKPCWRCGVIFLTKPNRNNKHCSIKCRRPNGKRQHACLQCHEVFFDSRAFAKFCSVECHNVNQTGERREEECGFCGNVFTTKRDHGTWPTYCSRKCFIDGVRLFDWEERPEMTYMGGGKYKGAHRLLVEETLGRELEIGGEPVVHLNGNRRDNRLDNLYLFPSYEIMGAAFSGGIMPVKSNLLNINKA